MECNEQAVRALDFLEVLDQYTRNGKPVWGWELFSYKEGREFKLNVLFGSKHEFANVIGTIGDTPLDAILAMEQRLEDTK